MYKTTNPKILRILIAIFPIIIQTMLTHFHFLSLSSLPLSSKTPIGRIFQTFSIKLLISSHPNGILVS